MPGRRTNLEKAQAAIYNVGECQVAKRRKVLQEQVQALLKDASEAQLLAVQGVLQGKAADEEEDGPRFPRGVTTVGGDPPKGVPMKVRKTSLAAVTGQSLGVIEQVSKEDITWLYLWGCGCKPGDPIPERRMLLSEFIQWFTKRHEEVGGTKGS